MNKQYKIVTINGMTVLVRASRIQIRDGELYLDEIAEDGSKAESTVFAKGQWVFVTTVTDAPA